MKLLNNLSIDPHKIVQETSFYKTRTEIENGRKITFHNDRFIYKVKSLPSEIAIRFFSQNRIETTSWCYTGMPIKERELLSILKVFASTNPDFSANTTSLEDISILDQGWKLIDEYQCISMTTIDKRYALEAYVPMRIFLGNQLYTSEDVSLLELVVLSTCVMRLTFDDFFFHYSDFIQSQKEISQKKNLTLAMIFQNTILEMSKIIKNVMTDSKENLMKSVRENTETQHKSQKIKD